MPRRPIKKKKFSRISAAEANTPTARPSGAPASPYIPQDQLTGEKPDRVLGADLLELIAFFANDNRALVSELGSALEIGQDEYSNIDETLRIDRRATSAATVEIEMRARHLRDAYPYSLSESGAVLTFDNHQNWGRTLYILSLILSHLPSERSPVLERAGLLPTDADTTKLRRWFQYCATASVAAEIGGDAWAFGWPRPDGTAFLHKLKEIWIRLRDGDVRDAPLEGAPEKVKDDEIDIIAARPSCDGLQGFPIILGQVASGHNWRSKPLRNHADHVFYPEWFGIVPASQTLVYHIIPFVLDAPSFRRETRRLGHLMHRVRLCSRALEAHRALQQGSQLKIEGTDAFSEVDNWIVEYRSQRYPRDSALL